MSNYTMPTYSTKPQTGERLICNRSLSTSAAASVGDDRREGGSSQLQHGQPEPSVGDDRHRERLDFSVTEIVTEISEQLILPLSMGLTNFAVSYSFA